ncbi:hypothetical protein LOD99_13586 [Oopsacas minuta]|uniref:Uncharacterized protein n=1 Tax=Oopsacas minuta TaxID=111878 RepID=A0AAV7KHP7_9METZ|nr:hypothetical protein LOD99_13586 [Oopsacas minuta]
MSGTESIILEKSQKYEFKQDDDVWLTIWGIEKVMWRITVDGVFRDRDSLTKITFENKYFNKEKYTYELQKKDSLLPLPLPLSSHNSYTPSPFNYFKEQFGYSTK